MKILLTGANGFIGSHIAEKLSVSGLVVRCLVRKSSDLKWLKSLKVEFTYGDINEPSSLQKAVEGADVVVHAAGVLRARDKKRYYEVNQIGTKNVVNAVNDSQVKKIIYISSLAAHGPSKQGSARSFSDESAPVSDYGRSKLAGEREIKNNSKKPWTILVPSAVYGPRDKDMFFFFKLVSMGLSIKSRQKRLINLSYVDDIASAVEKSIHAPISDFKTYYVADKKVFSWEDICNVLAVLMKKKTFSFAIPDFLLYVASFFSEKISAIFGKDAVFNIQKVDEMVQDGWLLKDENVTRDLNIKFTDFFSGAQKTYNWYKENRWLK